MIADPWQELGLEPIDDDAAIRARYRELVKLHPPERDPLRFAAIAEAFAMLRDPRARARTKVLGPPPLTDLGELEQIVRRWPRCTAGPEAWLGVIGHDQPAVKNDP